MLALKRVINFKGRLTPRITHLLIIHTSYFVTFALISCRLQLNKTYVKKNKEENIQTERNKNFEKSL